MGVSGVQGLSRLWGPARLALFLSSVGGRFPWPSPELCASQVVSVAGNQRSGASEDGGTLKSWDWEGCGLKPKRQGVGSGACTALKANGRHWVLGGHDKRFVAMG